MYNDQAPNLTSDDEKKGHSKELLATDGKQGFWIVHSVPHFPPPLEQRYDYPATEKYGQSLLCVTMSVAEIDKTSFQLLINQVQIYISRMPAALQATHPNLAKIINGVSVMSFSSVGGATFTSFAKNPEFGKELYKDLVAPTLNSELLVETWRLGSQGFLASVYSCQD